jgi:hypothetical protein
MDLSKLDNVQTICNKYILCIKKKKKIEAKQKAKALLSSSRLNKYVFLKSCIFFW